LVQYGAWNDDGSGVVAAIYESEDDADAAWPQIQAIWGKLSGLLTGTPEVQTFNNVQKMR